MGVGDINSTERGTGARFNDGKAPLELIPLKLLAEYYGAPSANNDTGEGDARWCLLRLAEWQETGDRDKLIHAMAEIDAPFAEAAFVLDYGRKKYAEWNWAKGMPWSVCVGCAVRHLVAVIEGETVDPESHRHHFGHVMCNLIFLLTFVRTYPEGDDRPRVLQPKEAA
jgi:hypothetical protein